MYKAWIENISGEYLAGNDVVRRRTATTRARYTTLRYGAFRRPVRWCDCCHTSRGEVLGVVR